VFLPVQTYTGGLVAAHLFGVSPSSISKRLAGCACPRQQPANEQTHLLVGLLRLLLDLAVLLTHPVQLVHTILQRIAKLLDSNHSLAGSALA
jgi:hypothetical protein